MVALRFVVVLHLVLFGCGCSNESPAEPAALGGSKAPSGSADRRPNEIETKVGKEESRAVIELFFLELSSSEADDIRQKLEQVANVEKVKVDLETKWARCLMKEWTAGSDVEAAVKALKDALGKSHQVAGSSSEIHSSHSWKTLKLKW